MATDIAARGIDIEQLPFVINFELPYVPEDYVHRIGRTGRAGMPGEAISLVSSDELKLLADIEKLLKRPIARVGASGLDERPSRSGHRPREHRESETRPPRVHPRDVARKPPIAKTVAADGFDFSKPYEPDAEPAVAVDTAQPSAPRRGTARPVAALLGGLLTPRK